MSTEAIDLPGLGALTVVDLAQPLTETTPTIQLPEPFANTPPFRLHEISRYDERGPVSYWNWFECGEHVGTHLDAPNHWVSGQGGRPVDEIPLRQLVAPAVVIDRTDEAAADPDYLLGLEDVRAFEAEHGPLPEGGWLLYRTGWSRYAQDQEQFLNADESGAHTPGIQAECARWLAEESGIIGIGVETVGTDAGQAFELDPVFPVHHYMHGAGKLGLTQLANLDRLPATGTTLAAAPLKIEGGSGSPTRVYGLLPR
nr:cyclase family protein [Egibacter rhizosphaerae]